MTDHDIEFDDLVALAMARAVEEAAEGPRPELRQRVLARVRELSEPPPPPGFSFRYGADEDWQPHPVPGIRMKVLAMNPEAGYAALLLDVAPGTRFPAHHHRGGEECYVLSGSLYTCGRRIEAGDFLHADAGTQHGELWTEEGCRVLLVAPPEDYLADERR